MEPKFSSLTATLCLLFLFTTAFVIESSSLHVVQSNQSSGASFGSCNTSSQCNPTSYEVFYCQASECTCPSYQIYGYVPEVGRAMCLVPAHYGQACKYDIQCENTEDYTACGDDGTCECKEWYWRRGQFCEYRNLWRAGSITGVVLACIFPFGALAGLIAYLIYRMDKKESKEFPAQNRGISEPHTSKKTYEKLEEDIEIT